MSDTNQGWASDGDDAIDLTGISGDRPPPLADGVYEFEVVEAHAQGSKPDAAGKVKPGFSMKLKAHRAFGQPDGSAKGNVYDNVYITAESAWRLVQLRTALGSPDPNGRFRTTFEAIQEFCGEIVGSRMWARTKQEEYPKGSGKVNAKIAAYFTEEKAGEAAAGVTSASEPARKTRAQLAAERAAAE